MSAIIDLSAYDKRAIDNADHFSATAVTPKRLSSVHECEQLDQWPVLRSSDVSLNDLHLGRLRTGSYTSLRPGLRRKAMGEGLVVGLFEQRL